MFRSAYEEICRHVAATQSMTDTKGDRSRKLSPQLTATQENLLVWTMETYSVEAKQLLDAYIPGAARGEHGLGATRDLANTVHHFAHGLENTGMVRSASAAVQQQNAVLAVRLRQQVYELMAQNLKAQRAIHLRDHKKAGAGRKAYPYPEDWPELVKTVATAGQHLLAVGERCITALVDALSVSDVTLQARWRPAQSWPTT